ncbi:arsenate reductase (thioredoxin) [Levilactobacillus acidifarinae DSM 19394]|uniref:Arsenate reductase (Thioredoxin) n=2 Tax=Levilactobacillus acidifarinae TaxID=267364 RepID=A0A0R1LJB2_9LACO|nr:arsenate reductase (thioredoxin) [Levilactobacillus acidifarinae DSM 19394]
MAEGLARQVLGPEWRVASAGLETHGLNPRAVQVMAEIGIDISQQTSKVIDPNYLAHCDLVVTLCGDARDRCPVTPPTVHKQHWPLPDPAQATGSAAQQLAVFRAVRDQIRQRVSQLAKIDQ